jgi:hypothetical protein
VPLPRAELRRCAALAPRRAVRVLCPTALPTADWFVRYQTLRGGRSEYLTSLETRPAGSGTAFHALAGGRRKRFSLATRAGAWPMNIGLARDLGLVGAKPLNPGQPPGHEHRVRPKLLRRTTVRRNPALLLAVARYPDGGVHGGHLAVVWNQGDDGYTLSLHFTARGARHRAQQQSVLVRAAAAMSRFPAGDRD